MLRRISRTSPKFHSGNLTVKNIHRLPPTEPFSTFGISLVPRLESVSSSEMRNNIGCWKSLKSLTHMPVDKCRLCLLSKS